MAEIGPEFIDAIVAPDPCPVPLRLLWACRDASAMVSWHDRLMSIECSWPNDVRRIRDAMNRLPANSAGRALVSPRSLWALSQGDDSATLTAAYIAALDAMSSVQCRADLAPPSSELAPGPHWMPTSNGWLLTGNGMEWAAAESNDVVTFGNSTVLASGRDSFMGGCCIDAYPKLVDPAEQAGFAKRLSLALRGMIAATPGFARGIEGMVRAIVPMRVPPRGLPSTSTNAVPGAMCITASSEPALLGDQVVHEATHELLFLFQEHDPLLEPRVHGDGWTPSEFYSPWRDDLRPLNGLLHGTVVFTRVAFLHARTAKHDVIAARRLAAILPQIRIGLEQLSDCATMTANGARLLKGMAEAQRMLRNAVDGRCEMQVEPMYVEASSILSDQGDAEARQAAHQRRVLQRSAEVGP